MEIMTSKRDYPFHRTAEEYERLRKQSKMWEPSTLRIFQKIGLCEGMRCLDVGCGPGAVTRLMGELVGPTGHITGIDADGNAGRQAIEMLRATTESHFTFIEQDLETAVDIPGSPFDVTYARFVVYHLHDPLVILRKMFAWTKHGGYIVVQDYDVRTWDIYPGLEVWDKFSRFLSGVLSHHDRHIGYKLPVHLVNAGIGDPDGTDVTGILGSLEQYGELLREIYRSLMPRAIQMGITTEAESEELLETLSAAEKSEQYYSILFPLLIGVWKRKPL
jgi:ubiquinone/menaquinone biosynthesis C-methylase UbiE